METVAIITALAALVTGLASLFSIFEMKKQRTATSRPILKLTSKESHAIFKHDKNEWHLSSSNSLQLMHTITLGLVNFGAGPAVNVMAKWEVDFNRLTESLKYFDPYNQIEIDMRGQSIRLGDSYHYTHNQRTQTLDAIPVYSSFSSETIFIPSYYISAFTKYVELALIKRPDNNDDKPNLIQLPDFPDIFLRLHYEDINGVILEQKFSITPSIYSVQEVAENKSQMDFMIQAKEIKSSNTKDK